MPVNQSEVDANASKYSPLEITDWTTLIEYTQYLNRAGDQTVKICVVDEENEEIRIDNKEEFDMNVQCARNHGLKSVKVLVYMDNVHKFDGIYHIATAPSTMGYVMVFPAEKLQILRNNILADKWFIPVKLDEPLGLCLQSAILIVEQGQFNESVECQQFIDTIVPEAFRKLQTTQSVFTWPSEIHSGIFDMLELLVDLTSARLRFPPVPIPLLNALAISFDFNTTFSQKHKTDSVPAERLSILTENDFLRTPSNKINGSYAWLRAILQRFLSRNGLTHLCAQFEHINKTDYVTATLEYTGLLKVFSKCFQFIEAARFRSVFAQPVRQAIDFLLETRKTQNRSSNQLNELNETLIEVCFNYEMGDELNELLQVSSIPKSTPVETAPASVPLIPLKMALGKPTKATKSKTQDCYERLAENVRLLTMNSSEPQHHSMKKQRMDEQAPTPLLNHTHALDGTDDSQSSTDKRSLKRKHRREQQRLLNTHTQKKDKHRSSATTVKTYDRSDPADVLRFFGPMRTKIAALYEDLQTATWHGNMHQVLKIEEKLKLIRPYSARFITDENTPDGTKKQPGQVFRKVWILLNDGSMPWNSEDIQLVNLTDGIEVIRQPVIPVVAPHDRAFISVDFVSAEQPGVYESKWILSYRHHTFGPMIWCSIEVAQASAIQPSTEFKETFELVDIPLPACFDLSKPYQSAMKTSNDTSIHVRLESGTEDLYYVLLQSSFSLSRSNSYETQTGPLIDIDTVFSAYSSDSDSYSTFLPATPPLVVEREQIPIDNPTLLVDLSPIPPMHREEEQPRARSPPSPKSNQPLHFVDAVVTNIFSVAKQAGSTAKAIFHTLQANEEVSPHSPSRVVRQLSIPSVNANQISNDDLFEHLDDAETPYPILISSNEPLNILEEMGFTDRAENQRLLAQNQNDLSAVIDLLTARNSIETD